MDGTLLATGTALWLGLLTSISPCPLASNIAAISYIGKGLAQPGRVLAAGLLYTAGRALVYALLSGLLAASLASIVALSNSLQSVMNQLLGPVLIVSGLFLVGLLNWSPGSGSAFGNLQEKADRWGLAGAAALGGIFALSFCPVSAALFFGSLIPLAARTGAPLLMPSVYGVGTAVPVLGFALLIACGSKALGSVFARVTRLELWARRTTGAVFIVVGLHYTVTYIFEWELL
jgi:cytochrome c-type biogenesis protein